MRKWTIPLIAAAMLAPLAAAPQANAQSIALQDSFRLGSGAGILCTAQLGSLDAVAVDMFDRAYSITCRDAAVPVGQLYALKDRGEDPAERLAAQRTEVECTGAEQAELEDVGTVEVKNCRRTDIDVGYRVYSWRQGDTLYVAEGLAGYDSALQLGLRTLVADRPVAGEVQIATTEAGDPASFARVQAGSLDPRRALAEAYRRNNAGSFAEAAEFFGTLLSRGGEQTQAEALINQALQESNLGRYAQANVLFSRAEEAAANDPVLARMLRNYRAIHLLNQHQPTQALAELDRPLPQGAEIGTGLRDLVIDADTAARLNADSPVSRQLSTVGDGLTPDDKIQIFDGQAEQLRGTILRLEGRNDEAAAAINQAIAQLAAVRGGRVTSTVWMRSQLLGELASLAEEQGNRAEAERQYQAASALLMANYPNSAALLNSQARLAAFYSRTGQTAAASTLYRQIVDANAESGNSSPTLRRTLEPYFAILDQQQTPEAAADMFRAGQVLVRPGVAQTQAVLARELSGGSGEASRLFRQSVNLTRDIERTRIDLSRLESDPQQTPAKIEQATALRASLEQMQQDQVATQARLAAFPRYRAVSSKAVELSDIQQLLHPGEAYYKMIVLDDGAYGVFATGQSARAFRLGSTRQQLEQQVDALRATISIVENGQPMTYPFDVEGANQLYQSLFGPVSNEMASVTHLVFEPDGAMLRLPPNLLVMDRAGVEAYQARTADPNSDAFDFRGIDWLGRDRDISTSVSARAFRDVRETPPSDATAEYIGFGQNAVVNAFFRPSGGTRGIVGEQDDCSWSLAAWNRPISAEELFTARRAITSEVPGEAEIVTGEAFTDTAIKQREDLSNYRIVHFATHGLVTAPRPECPARPALLTSFGNENSDGLLTFAEIFDLRLDADLVILSACDTAGRASVAATREAGLTTGGDYALDGLVRAFVGAGGRMVIASHWPLPDDFDATQRLISGLFTAPVGTSAATALRSAQRDLMDHAETSHPYYWSGFAVVGDGAAPVIRPVREQTAQAN